MEKPGNSKYYQCHKDHPMFSVWMMEKLGKPGGRIVLGGKIGLVLGVAPIIQPGGNIHCIISHMYHKLEIQDRNLNFDVSKLRDDG